MEPLPKSGLAWTAKLISPLAVLSSCPVRQTSDFAPLHGGITSEIPVHAPYLAAERRQFFYVMMGANFRGANSNPPTLRQFLNVSRVRNSKCQLERKPERKKVLVPPQISNVSNRQNAMMTRGAARRADADVCGRQFNLWHPAVVICPARNGTLK